jgi:hypothetical protein
MNATLDQLKVDRSNLYREESYTDLKVASLRQLVPITPDGDRDLGREVVFLAQTQLMSQMGPLPVQARIEAATLAEAIDKFPEAMQVAVEQLVEEVREEQRREAGRIVTPGETGFPGKLNLK